MELNEYRAFTNELQKTLQQDNRVLGLIAVGSMAEQGTLPDQWSDHDFWLVVEAGAQTEFRQSTHWLPGHEQIVCSFPETEHGIKAVYRSGHLLEFAVFDLQELHLASANRYRILIDKAGLEKHLAQIREATLAQHRTGATDDYLIGQLITNVLVAGGRWKRGERLSGRSFLMHAARHLALLIAKHGSEDQRGLLDNLDPLRRFEFSFPEAGAEIDRALQSEIPKAGISLLEIAEQRLKSRVSTFPEEAFGAVRRKLS